MGEFIFVDGCPFCDCECSVDEEDVIEIEEIEIIECPCEDECWCDETTCDGIVHADDVAFMTR